MGLVKDLEKILDYPRGPNCHHRYANKLEIKGDLTQTQRRRPRDEGESNWRDDATSQGTARITWSLQMLEEGRKAPPPETSEGPWPC